MTYSKHRAKRIIAAKEPQLKYTTGRNGIIRKFYLLRKFGYLELLRVESENVRTRYIVTYGRSNRMYWGLHLGPAAKHFEHLKKFYLITGNHDNDL